ncbi:MAG TPA: TIGR02391 family protein [Jatrophihabitans sp.]|nr:TIGR02391 family protein [Jatrophihabitans sp.]
MRWDDLQILRSIDEIEQSGQYLGSGLNLLDRLAREANVAPYESMREFAIELALAYHKGYLTWVDRSSQWVGHPSPTTDANMWLQTFDDIRLTLDGRDRARGRVIQTALPDPDEDDGRIIAGLTLEEAARSIGDTYTASQLPRYLRESGLSADAVPGSVTGDKWEYVFDVLSSLHDGGSAARRTLREFLGGWLEGRYHTPPRADVRKRIVALLAQQGWHVRDGRLVIGERVYAEAGIVSPLAREARLAALHAEIRQVTERFVDDHLDVAIFEAFKAINNRVKEMTGLDLDGSKLMDAVFGPANPRIRFADSDTETGRSLQQGLHFLFKGAVQGIRNPDAHEQFKPLDEEEGLETLMFASMLMRRLDRAYVTPDMRPDGA